MHIQVFSEYLQLGQAGRVKPLACPMHKEEEAFFPLYHKEENDSIVLNCYACDYKQIVGQTLYNLLIQRIEEAHKVSAEK
jgi:hypothetical protein